MGKRFSYFFTLLVALLLCSCIYEQDMALDENCPSVNLSLAFVPVDRQNVSNTRATDDENFLKDLRVYVFGASTGVLCGYGELTGDGNTSLATPEGTISFKTSPGAVRIYAMANMQTSQYWADSQDRLDLDPNNYSSSTLSLSEFQTILFKRQAGALSPMDLRFMMSGNVNNGETVTINRQGQITSPTTADKKLIKLYRVMSKNTFNFTVQDPSNQTFTLRSYTIANIAEGGSLVPNANNTTVNATESISAAATSNSFLFYLPENKRSVEAATQIGEWKDRESDSYASGQRVFTNAPSGSSYVTVYGSYTAGSTLSADVSYTIHLGDFGSSLYNFNVLRNYNYTYNITIKGVNDIVVEAQVEGENPYAEGIVIESTAGEAFTLDAHYEARVMKFYQNDIKALKNALPSKGYLVRFSTAFGQSESLMVKGDGVYNSTGLNKLCGFTNGQLSPTDVAALFTGEADYKWIKLMKNTNSRKIHTITDVCKYPGTSSTDLKDVFAAMKELYEKAGTNSFFDQSDTKGRFACYTCFVDENYYPDKQWGTYTNVDSRKAYIANDIAISNDNKSIYATVQYYLSQRPIYTFYNTANSQSLTAFGTESVEEDRNDFSRSVYDIPYSSISSISPLAGRTAALDYQTDSDFYSDNAALSGQQDTYTKVSKACMSRNRDLNGNGTIDSNEIKWYLATNGQYLGIWIGENIQPAETRLFVATEMDKIIEAVNSGTVADVYTARYHYFAASKLNIFWPEEGASSTPVNFNSQGNGLQTNDRTWAQAQNVRCVRSLRSFDDGLVDPDAYFAKSGNTISLAEKIDAAVFRTEQSTSAFPVHHERQEQNRIYSQFTIADKDLSGTFNQASVIGTTSGTNDITWVTAANDVCFKALGAPWRTPNQRELAVMSLDMSWAASSTYFYWSNTDFSGRPYKHNSGCRGFCLIGTLGITIGSDGNRVRCIRDGAQ